MSFMAWRINKYLLESSSIPVGRSMFRRPRNFHDAGRANQSCMGNIPHYKASSVSLTQLSPFRWYNRHTLQLDDVEYIIKNIDSLHTALISTTQHITIRQSLLNPTTSYSTRMFMESTKRDRHATISIRAFLIEWHEFFSFAGRGIESRGKDWKHEIEQQTSRRSNIFTIAPMFT